MEDALIKRVLPHSTEAEQSVIGSMLMDKEAVLAASEIITKDDFYERQYGVMFEAMVELYQEGKPVDLVTVQEGPGKDVYHVTARHVLDSYKNEYEIERVGDD